MGKQITRYLWTPDRDSQLTVLYNERLLSYLEMAIAIFGEHAGKKGRCAVAGRLHRLGLSRDSTPEEIQNRRSEHNSRRRSDGSMRYRKNAAPRPRNRNLHKAKNQSPKIKGDGYKSPVVSAEQIASGCSFFNLPDNGCKRPLAGEGISTIYCGQPVISGSFCKTCATLLYQPHKEKAA